MLGVKVKQFPLCAGSLTLKIAFYPWSEDLGVGRGWTWRDGWIEGVVREVDERECGVEMSEAREGERRFKQMPPSLFPILLIPIPPQRLINLVGFLLHFGSEDNFVLEWI